MIMFLLIIAATVIFYLLLEDLWSFYEIESKLEQFFQKLY